MESLSLNHTSWLISKVACLLSSFSMHLNRHVKYVHEDDGRAGASLSKSTKIIPWS